MSEWRDAYFHMPIRGGGRRRREGCSIEEKCRTSEMRGMEKLEGILKMGRLLEKAYKEE